MTTGAPGGPVGIRKSVIASRRSWVSVDNTGAPLIFCMEYVLRLSRLDGPMLNPDDLSMMTEQEKLDLLRQIGEAEECQDCFEPIYRRLMGDESPQVRQEAVAALWDLADPRHVEPLMRMAESDPDDDVRAKAASVLGIYIYEAVVNGALDEARYLSVRRFLLDLAQNPREDILVRRMALESLSFDADETVHDLIDWAYRHPVIEVKMTALFAMGRSRSPRWTEAILAELDSSERQLQLEAINAAAEAGLSAGTPKLRNLAVHKDREIRLAAIWSLASTRGPGALETLEMCAQSEDEETRNAAGEALDEFYHASRYDDEESDDDTEE
jgi:HEAT repeat protein